MTTKRRARTQLMAAAIVATLSGAPWVVRDARAGSPPGACCLPDGSCEDDQYSDPCEMKGGFFLGFNTRCSETTCSATQTAPMLTFFGLVSVVGALIGLGLHGLLFRRR